MITATYQWLCPQKRKQRSEAEKRARRLFFKRSWYEVVILSIPVFVAAGVNNFVAAIIVLSSEDAEDHLSAEIGQQFLYTFFFSYLIGKWLFHSVAKHIIACQASQTVEDRWGLLDFCKRTKSLTLLARAINENASFSIKEFMMLVLVEKVYEEEGFGAAFGGWWLGFAVFVLVLLVSTLMASGLFRLEGEMVHWLKEYDVDSFALGAGAVFVALVGKGLSVEGVTFISPNSVFYGPSAADDDGAVAGNTAAYSLMFSLGITFVCSVLLIVEDSVRGIAVDLETEDDFVDILAIPAKHSTDTHGDVMPRPSHMMPSSTWGVFEDILFDFYHAILGCLCGVGYFIMATSVVLGWVNSWTKTTPLATFLAMVFLAYFVSQRAPDCLLSGKFRARRTIKQLTSNREYLESAKARDGSYRGGIEGGTPSTSAPATEEEETTWCERRCGAATARWWSQFLDFYYRTMLHRRRLAIIAIKLTVGWTWEVVVASFLKLVTESIELTAAQEVGVRLAIVVIILISSAAVFYWFKDGEALYLVDPFADPEVTAETELRPGGNNTTPDNNDVAVNPMASHSSTMNR